MFENAIILGQESGYGISVKHQRIADIIQDYDPTLELAWIPPDKRDFNDIEPFAVIHRPGNGKQSYVAMTLREDQINETLLARLWSHDNKNGSVLTWVEAQDAARNAVILKEKMDDAEMKRDLVSHIVSSNKNTYHHGGVAYR
jgi:hypothetical protein